MRSLIRVVSIITAVALAAPTMANDAQDTATEKKSQLRKSVRDLKPGEKTAGDRVDDANDTAKESAAKARKKARHGKRKVQKRLDDATK